MIRTQCLARIILLFAIVLFCFSSPAVAAPGDFDGDGKTDFTVARLVRHADSGCDHRKTPAWSKCTSSDAFLSQVAWLTKFSDSSEVDIRSVKAAVVDGHRGYAFDATAAPLFRYFAFQARVLLRSDIYTEYSSEDGGRLGTFDQVSGFAREMDGTANWFGATPETTLSSLTTDQIESYLAGEKTSQVSADFGNLDGLGDRTVSLYGVPGGFLVAPPKGAALPNDLSALLFSGRFLVLEDYDGDGKDEVGVWNNSDGVWTIRDYEQDTEMQVQWGLPSDHPMPGDYDGDGRSDLAVWRPSEANWYILLSTRDFDRSRAEVLQFGLPRTAMHTAGSIGDMPVKADFDGDGKLELCVYRTSTGTWYYRRSSDGVVLAKQWGLATDLPVGLGILDRWLYRWE